MKRTNEEQQPRPDLGPEMQRHQDRQAQREGQEQDRNKPVREQDERARKPIREEGEQDPRPNRDQQAPGKDFDRPDEPTERAAGPHTDTTQPEEDDEEFGNESATEKARS